MNACTAVRHNDLASYAHSGCRCPAARAAKNRANKASELRRLAAGTPSLLVPATGTIRRLRALVAIGWTGNVLAERLNMWPEVLRTDLLCGRRTNVRLHTAARVADLYSELADQHQVGPYATRATRMAARKGWLPPVAWDYDTLDDPAFTDDMARELITRTRCTEIRDERLDRIDQVGELITSGHTHKQVAELLDITPRQVMRDLTDWRTQQAEDAA